MKKTIFIFIVSLLPLFCGCKNDYAEKLCSDYAALEIEKNNYEKGVELIEDKNSIFYDWFDDDKERDQYYDEVNFLFKDHYTLTKISPLKEEMDKLENEILKSGYTKKRMNKRVEYYKSTMTDKELTIETIRKIVDWEWVSFYYFNFDL